MNNSKKTWAMVAVIGFALGFGGCAQLDQMQQRFDEAVSHWNTDNVYPLGGWASPINYSAGSAAPAMYDVDGNGTVDLAVGDASGYIEVLLNDSTDDMNIVDSFYLGDASGPTYFCDDASPVMYDWTQDGIPEMVVGCGDGTLMWAAFSTVSSDGLVYLGEVQVNSGFVVAPGGYAVPAIADVDQDGLPDLLVGAGDGSIYFFKNVGAVGAPAINYGGKTRNFGSRAAIATGDVDGDGVFDFVVGNEAGEVWACPSFGQCRLVGNCNEPTHPTMADFNHDGMTDLAAGVASGYIWMLPAAP